MTVNETTDKNRQKLLRNLRVGWSRVGVKVGWSRVGVRVGWSRVRVGWSSCSSRCP